MAIKALTGLQPEWFIPASQEGESDAAEFYLKPLTAPEVAKIQSQFDPDTGSISGIGLYEAAVSGVIDWRNVNDHGDKPLNFSRRNIDLLPYALILELGGEVLGKSLLTGEDEKNS
jgi:hypothetical protein